MATTFVKKKKKPLFLFGEREKWLTDSSYFTTPLEIFYYKFE